MEEDNQFSYKEPALKSGTDFSLCSSSKESKEEALTRQDSGLMQAPQANDRGVTLTT